VAAPNPSKTDEDNGFARLPLSRLLNQASARFSGSSARLSPGFRLVMASGADGSGKEVMGRASWPQRNVSCRKEDDRVEKP